MKRPSYIDRHVLSGIVLLLLLLATLVACTGNSSTISSGGINTTPTQADGSASGTATPSGLVHMGIQPCPVAVSGNSYWDAIIGTESGVSAVGRVLCANLMGNAALQALVVVFYNGTGQVADVHVYNNITSPSPTQIFKLQGLYKGNATISNYNTVMTAEVDQGSSVNKNQSDATFQQDLFREFAWSSGAGTLVPVSFPGIFPDLTRYQAEADQQQVNQGHQFLLSAQEVASKMATKLLNWSSNTSVSVVSGAGLHDKNAVVNVKSTNGGTIQVTLGRLEGNTNNGIWEVTSVTSTGMSITLPQSRDSLSSPLTVTGTDSAFNGKAGTVMVLNHLYNDVGHANATGANGNGSSSFSTHVNYSLNFKGGAQEGLLALYSYSGDGSISGAVIIKELLSA